MSELEDSGLLPDFYTTQQVISRAVEKVVSALDNIKSTLKPDMLKYLEQIKKWDVLNSYVQLKDFNSPRLARLGYQKYLGALNDMISAHETYYLHFLNLDLTNQTQIAHLHIAAQRAYHEARFDWVVG